MTEMVIFYDQGTKGISIWIECPEITEFISAFRRKPLHIYPDSV